MRNYIPIDVKHMPDIFEIELAEDTFTFRVDYNQIADYYTLTIWDSNGNMLLGQEPLLLGQMVGGDIGDTRLPMVDLVTMDETGQAKDAGKGELGYNVQLYLDVIDPNGSEDKDPSTKPLGYDPDEPADDMTDEEVAL